MAFPITDQADLYYRGETPNPGANAANRVYPSEGRFAAQPYIIRNIGETWGPTSFDEGIIRGGIVTSTSRISNDVIRITKFNADLSKGPLFLAKNAGLQLMNPRMWMSPLSLPIPSPASFNQPLSGFLPSERASSVAGGSSTLHPQLTNTQIFNPASILLNVGSSPLGFHFQRHGIPGISEDYGDIVKRNNDGIENLNGVSNETIFSQGDLEVTVEQRGGPLNDPSKSRLVNLYVNHILYDYKTNSHLIQYPTGPGSMLGLGDTTIRRFDNTRLGVKNYIESYNKKQIVVGDFIKRRTPTLYKAETDLGLTFTDEEKRKEGLIESRITTQPSIFDAGIGVSAFTYNQIKEASSGSTSRSNVNFRDFRQVLGLQGADDYQKMNIHNRVGVMDNSIVGSVDKINATDIYTPGNSNDVLGNSLPNGDDKWTFQRDLIKFAFEVINNDSPSQTEVITFRAYIDSFKDDYSAKINTVKYIGRGEEFPTYEGFGRKINVDFNIFAHSKQEMKPLYRKLLYLFSQTAPDISKSGYMRAPFIKLTIGNWFYRLPGLIDSIGTSIRSDETPWEIALNQPEDGSDSDMLELPKLLKISLSFVPLHNFTPQKGKPLSLTPFLHLKSMDGKTNWLNGGKTAQTSTNNVSTQNAVISQRSAGDTVSNGQITNE